MLIPVDEKSRRLRFRRLITLWSRQLVRNRYYKSRIGAFWIVLEPLLTALVFWLAFELLLDRSTNAEAPYILVFLTAYIPYQFFQKSLTVGARSLVGRARLVKNFDFPASTIVLSIAVAHLFELAVGLALLAVIFVLTGTSVSVAVLGTLPILMLYVALSVGASFLIAAATVWTRDLSFLTSAIARLGLWLSAVVYSVDDVRPNEQNAYLWNPLAAFHTAFRDLLFHGELRYPTSLIRACVVSLVIATIGYGFFKRREPRFGDML